MSSPLPRRKSESKDIFVKGKFVILVNMTNYTPCTLYEESFNMDFKWHKHLNETVFKFHNLMGRELNTPIELQMGTILPFITACVGPQTQSVFFTEPSVLNIFWMNIAASGISKSQSCKKLIGQPLEYMMKAKDVEVPDFEVCSFTRAGTFILIYILLYNCTLHRCSNCSLCKGSGHVWIIKYMKVY